MNLCPSLHHDKLPLRIVQCLDGPGTTLVSSNGETIETEENDLIFLKGEMWKSDVGLIKKYTWDERDGLLEWLWLAFH